MAVKKHNAEIDLAKFLFSVIILIYHSKMLFGAGEDTLLRYAYTGTEFFFIVSGYFMARSAVRYEGKPLGRSTWEYTINKVKVFYPYLLVAFVFTFLVRQYVFSLTENIEKSWISDLLLASNELLLLQTSGIGFNSLFNGPSWYLSAMIIAIAMLFPLLLKVREWFVHSGSLLLAILLYAFLSNQHSHLNLTRDWAGVMEAGLLRAMAGLCLGVFLCGLVERVQERGIVLRRPGKALLLVIQLLLCAAMLVIMQFEDRLKGTTRFDYVMVLLQFFLCFILFSEQTGVGRILPTKLCAYLGKISLPVYLNHRGIIYLYNTLELSLPYEQSLLILLAATAVSVPLTEGVLWLCRAIGHRLLPRLNKVIFADTPLG